MKVAIAGAGAVGRSIARELVDAHEVTLLERDPDHIELIAACRRCEIGMTKEEWASSCRDTLQYFPEGN